MQLFPHHAIFQFRRLQSIEFQKDLKFKCVNEPDYELLTEMNELSLHYNKFEVNTRTTSILVFSTIKIYLLKY